MTVSATNFGNYTGRVIRGDVVTTDERKRDLFLQMYRENCIKEKAAAGHELLVQNYQQRGYAYEDAAMLLGVDYGILMSIKDSVNENDWEEYVDDQGEISYRPVWKK